MEVFDNDLYKDQLTNSDNYFSFIRSDFNKLFGENGTVLIFDIAEFRKFNSKYGRNNGDLCIKCLSDAINKVLHGDSETFVFRTHGDEFTCIFPDKIQSYVEDLCNAIDVEYKSIMSSYGFNDIKLHTLILNYEEKINSVEDYYIFLIKNSFNQSKESDDKFHGERLLRHVIGGINKRVVDTFSRYKDAYNFALVDDVSGTANHRAGIAFIQNLIDESRNNKTEFSLLFIDGDNLRRYNKISYQAGNDIIKKLCGFITGSVRNEDKVYRWLSGDEFIVVLKGTNGKNAVKLAERIRQIVEEQTKDFIYPTTISIGVACYPDDAIDTDDLINKAERANAAAKSLGKNRVVKWTRI